MICTPGPGKKSRKVLSIRVAAEEGGGKLGQCKGRGNLSLAVETLVFKKGFPSGGKKLFNISMQEKGGGIFPMGGRGCFPFILECGEVGINSIRGGGGILSHHMEKT